MKKNMLGAYGPWAEPLVSGEPGELSFRNPSFTSVAAWRRKAMAKAQECLIAPQQHQRPKDVRVDNSYEHDGLHTEELSWQLPGGPRTEAVLLKPAGVRGRLPGLLAMHDHGGQYYFGHPKIAQTRRRLSPLMDTHRSICYGGVAWANEAARRGYVVLVPDAFVFGSRRVRRSDVPADAGSAPAPRTDDEILEYNLWAWKYEDWLSRSLCQAGTSWAAMMLHDDQCALDYFCSRRDVDADRLGCAGLSGGGTRTMYLAGMDHRIKASMAAGVITTSRDFMMNRSHMSTWMLYPPLLPRYFDFCEIYALRVPLPTMVMSCNADPLYTLAEMKNADRILSEVFEKAGALDNYQCNFYPCDHQFHLGMQADCFAWLDSHLKPD